MKDFKLKSIIFTIIFINIITFVYSDWGRTNISGDDAVYGFPSLAIDSNDNPHLVYMIQAGAGLLHTYWDEVKDDWVCYRISYHEDPYMYDGYYLDMVLDSNDHPHLVHERTYGPMDQYHTEHWYYNGSDWIRDRIFPGKYAKIRIDKDDNVYVAYKNKIDTCTISCEKYNGDTWISMIDISDTHVHFLDDMELDNSGNPHITYTGWGWKIKYARWNGISWDIETVSDDEEAYDSEFAFGTYGYPHFVYINTDDWSIVYKYWTGVEYKKLDIEDKDYGETSLALDNENKPHILLGEFWHYDLFYATCENNTYPWSIDIVYEDDCGFETDSKFDSNNVLQATYDAGSAIVYLRQTAPPEIQYIKGENQGDRKYDFELKYIESENERPYKDCPTVHILLNGKNIQGSPYKMSYISGNYDTGAIYSVELELDSKPHYQYYFEAYDKWHCKAVGDGTKIRWLYGSDLSDIKIYPNPWKIKTNDKLFIENSTDEFTISIYTIAGKKVFEKYYGNKDDLIEISYKNDLKNISSGIYLINIRNNFNGNEVRKIALIK